MTDQEPFAYVCFKEKRVRGIISPECGKSKVKKFCGDFVCCGYEVKICATREEYEAFVADKSFQ